MRPDKWDLRFLRMAHHVSGWSKDQSTQCGAVLARNRRVLSTGYNGFPPGVNDAELRYHERPMKYFMTEHAERNAIYNAARHGVSTDGATCYVFGLHPCSRCVRAMLAAGVACCVFGYDSDEHPDGKSPHMDPMDFEAAADMLGDIKEVYYVARPTLWWAAKE